MGNDDTIRAKITSCIESQAKDTEQVLAHLHAGDTALAINQKCHTQFDPNPGYPEEVLQVIRQYPWWTQA